MSSTLTRRTPHGSVMSRSAFASVWSGRSRWRLSCSVIPCSTCACFTYRLLTGLTFLHTCPRSQLMTVLALDQNISDKIAEVSKGSVGGIRTPTSPVTGNCPQVNPPAPRSKDCRRVPPTTHTRWGDAAGPCFRRVSCPIHQTTDVFVADTGLLLWPQGWARTGLAGLRGAAQPPPATDINSGEEK